MNRNRRLGGYLLITLVLFGAGLIGPRAWATPSQARSRPVGSNADAEGRLVTGTANDCPADQTTD